MPSSPTHALLFVVSVAKLTTSCFYILRTQHAGAERIWRASVPNEDSERPITAVIRSARTVAKRMSVWMLMEEITSVVGCKSEQSSVRNGRRASVGSVRAFLSYAAVMIAAKSRWTACSFGEEVNGGREVGMFGRKVFS